MAKKKALTRRQLALLNNLFSGQFDEQSVLDELKTSRNVYTKWLSNDVFAEELNRRIVSAHRQSQVLIAQYFSVAAAKLVQLTDSEKEETARKACLDIISLPISPIRKVKESGEPKAADTQMTEQFSTETVSKLLELLAKEKNKT